MGKSGFARFAGKACDFDRAKHLLRTTGGSATQVAGDTGFCDLPHLIRVFRVAEGVTPEAYRQAKPGPRA